MHEKDRAADRVERHVDVIELTDLLVGDRAAAPSRRARSSFSSSPPRP
jgi:hypothetical protein